MVLEFFGYISGVGVIGLGLILLLRHQRVKLVNSFHSGRRRASRRGNALIWPSR